MSKIYREYNGKIALCFKISGSLFTDENSLTMPLKLIMSLKVLKIPSFFIQNTSVILDKSSVREIPSLPRYKF